VREQTFRFQSGSRSTLGRRALDGQCASLDHRQPGVRVTGLMKRMGTPRVRPVVALDVWIVDYDRVIRRGSPTGHEIRWVVHSVMHRKVSCDRSSWSAPSAACGNRSGMSS
jgi:hypothetical protein